MKKMIVVIVLLACIACGTKAQLPCIDKGVQAAGLLCFPLQGDSLNYVYLPLQAQMATNDEHLPQFSYMRYVVNRSSGNNNNQSIEDADGGALLNFLVLYDTPQDIIDIAEKTLRKKLHNDSIRLSRPIIFNSGRYSLISSAISGDSNVQRKQVLCTGNAPVMENSRVALSFGLTPFSSKLLLENLKMSTPDVSLLFDMEFSGLTEDYDATLDIDWSEIKNSQAFHGGVNFYYVAADIKLAFDELMKNQSIKLTVNGTNASMDALLQTVYDKLLNLMFTPVAPEQLPPQQQQSLLSSIIGSMSSEQGNNAFVNVGYQLKEMKSTGKSRLYFKGKATVQRHHYITFNIGNLYQNYGTNRAIFRDINMNDEPFKQRKVFIGIDGDMNKEFDQLLNSVTVFLSKQHLSGKTTVRNILIRKENKDTPQAFVYGYDEDTAQWLQYSQRTVWQFKGGATDTTGWVTQDASMINLFMPFKRRIIQLEGDVNQLAQKGIRAYSVQISYPFFSTVKQERITSGTSSPLPDQHFEITQPNDQPEIEYTITWIRNNGEIIQKTGKDKLGILFIDELPSQ